jgi:hypothetical protein
MKPGPAAYTAAGKNVTVKFRDLYQEGERYVFKFSLVAQGGKYIEGEALKEYDGIVTAHFSDLLGEEIQSVSSFLPLLLLLIRFGGNFCRLPRCLFKYWHWRVLLLTQMFLIMTWTKTGADRG